MPDVITSFANPTVKRVRQLADRKYRRRENAFVVEGLQPVWRAVMARSDIETLIVAPELLVNPEAVRMVEEQQRAGTRVVRVSGEVFARLSDRDGPAGLAAIVRGCIAGLDAFAPEQGAPVVALHEVGNPGNIGTILRTADATEAGGLILIGDTADPLAAASIKASMGALFAVPVAHADKTERFFAWATASARPVVAVTGSAATNFWDTAYPPNAVLLLGSEGVGLPEDIVDRCAASVAIPMGGTAESLNLATAASLVLYELMRRSSATHP